MVSIEVAALDWRHDFLVRLCQGLHSPATAIQMPAQHAASACAADQKHTGGTGPFLDMPGVA